jgi:hypothetical protein
MEREMALGSGNMPKQEDETPVGYTQVERQTTYLGPGWQWVEPSIWTENMLRALGNGVKKYFADLGLFTMEESRVQEIATRS